MPTIQQAFDTFILDCQTRNLRPATLGTYRAQIRVFINFAHGAGVRELDQVDTHLLRTYITSLIAEEKKPASIRTAAHVLRAWLNFCIVEGMIGADTPMRRVRTPSLGRPHPDAFTKDEVLALLANAQTPRNKAIILCLLDTGCRVGEFAALRVDDVNMHTGAVTIRAETAKSRRERTVYLGKHSRSALAEYLAGLELASDDGLWRTESGDEMKRYGLQSMLKRLAKRAGVSSAGPHRYRRTALSFMLRDGMDIYAVADIAGHNTIDLLKHYIAKDDAALAAAHAKHGMIDHLLEVSFP